MSDASIPATRVRTKSPPAPRTGWWWVALVLTLLMGLVLLVTAAVAVSATLAAEARRQTAGTPSAPPPGWATRIDTDSLPPPFESDPEKDEANVRAFFTRLATELRNPKGLPDELIDWSELSAAVPEDAVEITREEMWFGRQVVQSEQAVWKGWDWAKVNVRKVGRRPDGTAVEAVVMHTARDGRLAFRRWTFTDTPDGLQLLGWEDLRTGVTSRDLAYARATAALSPSVRRQRHWQFTQVNDLHRLIDQRQLADAERVLTRLKGVRFDGELHYAVDLAEARLTTASRRSKDAEWDDVLAVEILEDLVARCPHRLAAYLLLAEVHLLGEEYTRVIEVCDSYLSVTDHDPDALALRGAAHSALLRADDAAADFTAALALNRHQPRAVNWQRQQADAGNKKAVAEVLATAPDAAGLFDSLAEWAADDADWPGVIALAERFRKLRPTDTRWAIPLVDAFLNTARPDDAVQVFREAVTTTPAPERAELVRRFTTQLILHNHADKVYAAVPAAEAPVAFRLLAERYELFRGRTRGKLEGEPLKQQQAAIRSLTELFVAHRKAHPADPRLALHEGRLKFDQGEYDRAVEVLAPAVAAATPKPDAGPDAEPISVLLRVELLHAEYKRGRAVEAYRDFKHDPSAFNELAERHIADGDGRGLEVLLDERAKVKLRMVDEQFWRAEADRLHGRHADAAAKYKAYLGKHGVDLMHVRRAVHGRLRSLVAAGDAATAAKELEATPFANDLSLELRALVLVKAGGNADAEKLLRDRLEAGGWWVGRFYADPDLGPILRTDPAFADLRKDFPPPPVEKPIPPR